MKHCTHLVIRPATIARTPRLLGVNVEIQDHHDQTNLWDWLADSGATALREFHPEQTLRDPALKPDAWSEINKKADFDAWRQRVLADPAGPAIRWEHYVFDRRVPWIGVPDRIIEKVNALGIAPLYSLGYAPGLFGKPLIRDIHCEHVPTDDDIDWEAAASAYDYYFAVIHHYATRYAGQWFMMVNEPENRAGWFHLPDDLKDLNWPQLFWEADQATIDRYGRIIGAQYAALARLARMAIEDVRTLLGTAPNATHLRLTGPTTVFWQPLWRFAGQYLDALDFHHYHPSANTFPNLFAAAAEEASRFDKHLAISEFNQYSGGIPIDRNLFSLPNALQTADLVLTVLAMARPHDPPIDFATLYLFSFPSTHRNFKHLVYGDMNLVDWQGLDTPLWSRGKAGRAFGEEDWYPTFEEQQLRFATPAYHLFRMIARSCRNAAGQPHAFDVLDVGIVNPTTSGPQDVPDQLQVTAVDQRDRLIVNILNRTDTPARNCQVDLARLGRAYTFAIVRCTDRTRHDTAITQHTLAEDPATFNVPKRSLVQIIFTNEPLDQITSLSLKEQSITPGSMAGLDRWQTTRLRAIAQTPAGPLDITETNVIWTSYHPDIIRADQGGLIQRLRGSRSEVTITANTADDRISAQVVIPANQ